jgi:putative sigma-54 modulation protein
MLVKVTGRHMSVTEAMKAYAEEKTPRLTRIEPRISEIEVVLDFEGGLPKAEFIVDVERAGDFVASQGNKDMYAAIDAVIDKLERQLTDHRKRVTKSHHKGPQGEAV